MKNRLLSYLIILGLNVLSCNPIEEEETENSGVQDMTPAQANTLLQGEWYLNRTEVYSTYCAGEIALLKQVEVNNLEYSNFNFVFTNTSSSDDIDYLEDAYENITDIKNGFGGGGDYTFPFWTYTASNEMGFYNNPISPLEEGALGLAFSSDYLLGVMPFYLVYGGEIVELNEDEFILQSVVGNSRIRAVFIRVNSSNAPVNLLALLGTYQLDVVRNYEGGVFQSEESFGSGYELIFSNTPIPINNGLQVRLSGDIVPSIYLAGDFMPINYSYDGFNWTTTEDYVSINGTSFFVELSNENQLVLRNRFSCNTYDEYRFTKLN